MSRLPIGMIVLVVMSILVYFGMAHRLLDRMRLTDKGALAVIGALIVGSFIDIPLTRGNIEASVNVGGALVPVGLSIYLLAKAGTTKEWGRALFATVVTAGAIYFVGSVLMHGNPGERGALIDPLYVYPIVGGTIAYVLGRSRRAAFIAATLGVLSLDIIQWVWLAVTRTPGNVYLGGAGAFDSIVIAGLVAILLAEVIGETRERLQGGPATTGRDPELLKSLSGEPNKEYADMLKKHSRETQEEERRGEDSEGQ